MTKTLYGLEGPESPITRELEGCKLRRKVGLCVDGHIFIHAPHVYVRLCFEIQHRCECILLDLVRVDRYVGVPIFLLQLLLGSKRGLSFSPVYV